MVPLTPDMLVRAYASGIFPMARSRDDRRLYWIDPDQRGVIPLDTFHTPRSLRKVLRHAPFEVRCDTSFRQVMESCADTSGGRSETWINDEIIRLFVDLHELGLAHSVECWRDGQLAGGLYGLSIGAAFFGESMFSRATDASKVALVHLVARLRRGGYRLLDTQFVTEHLERFGAVQIPRRQYLRRLTEAIDERANFQCGAVPWEEALLQSSTQTS